MELRLPFDRFHVEALENWLNHEAAEGRLLVKLGRGSAAFKEEEARIKYHIDASDEAMKEKLGEAGWESVCEYRRKTKHSDGLTIYACRSKSPKVPDLADEDKAAFEKAHAAEVRRNLYSALWIPLVSILFMSMMEAFYGNQVGTLYLDDRIMWLFAVFIGISALVIVRAFRRNKALSMWKKHRSEKTPTDFYEKIQLRNEITLPLKDGFRKVAWITIAVLLGVELVCCIVRFAAHRGGEVDPQTPELLTLSEIEGTEVEKVVVDGFPGTIRQDFSLLVPSQRVVRFAAKAGEEQVVTRICQYQALNEGFAKELLIARMEAQLNWNIFISASPIQVDGAEQAYYAGYQGYHYLFMRNGNKIVTVFYNGDLKLSDHALAFTKYIQ